MKIVKNFLIPDIFNPIGRACQDFFCRRGQSPPPVFGLSHKGRKMTGENHRRAASRARVLSQAPDSRRSILVSQR